MNKHAQVLIVTLIALLIAMLAGGKVALNGIAVGFISFAAIWSLFVFFRPFRMIVNKWPLLGDVGVTVMVYILVPASGITAIMAAGTCAILFTMVIRLKKGLEGQKAIVNGILNFFQGYKEAMNHGSTGSRSNQEGRIYRPRLLPGQEGRAQKYISIS